MTVIGELQRPPAVRQKQIRTGRNIGSHRINTGRDAEWGGTGGRAAKRGSHGKIGVAERAHAELCEGSQQSAVLQTRLRAGLDGRRCAKDGLTGAGDDQAGPTGSLFAETVEVDACEVQVEEWLEVPRPAVNQIRGPELPADAAGRAVG